MWIIYMGVGIPRTFRAEKVVRAIPTLSGQFQRCPGNSCPGNSNPTVNDYLIRPYIVFIWSDQERTFGLEKHTALTLLPAFPVKMIVLWHSVADSKFQQNELRAWGTCTDHDLIHWYQYSERGQEIDAADEPKNLTINQSDEHVPVETQPMGTSNQSGRRLRPRFSKQNYKVQCKYTCATNFFFKVVTPGQTGEVSHWDAD